MADLVFFQGVDLHALCVEHGTPLYVYDARVMKRQADRFREAFRGLDISIMYAAKACPNLAIMSYMKSLGIGLDTVSVPEIHMGLSVGFSSDRIVFTPNMVDFSEIEAAVELGVSVTIDNLQNLETFARRYGNTRPVMIRVNPDLSAGDSGADSKGLDVAGINKEHYADVSGERVAVWHSQSKFGIALPLMDTVFQLVDGYGLRVCGIHVHSSHVILNQQVFAKAARLIFDLAARFPDLDVIDFGGGIMVEHHPDDTVVDLPAIGRLVKAGYDAFAARTGKRVTFWFEPGRFLVSEAGVLLTRAVVLKTNGRVDFVGTDTGFNHLIRPMMYDAWHGIVNLSNPDGARRVYNVVGNLCEIDNLACGRTLSQVREGDLLMIQNAGAYGFSMASNYNSRPRPAEILIHDGQPVLIRRRETLDDLVRCQIPVRF